MRRRSSEMTSDDDDVDATFERALEYRDAGNVVKAIEVLEGLAARPQAEASVFGMLAGLQLDVDDFANSARNARRATALSPKSDLSSRILFHALFGMGHVGDAFAEMARLRSLKRSEEYDRILLELEADALRDLQARPGDGVAEDLLERARSEMCARPVKG
jgi:hypothetical protein